MLASHRCPNRLQRPGDAGACLHTHTHVDVCLSPRHVSQVTNVFFCVSGNFFWAGWVTLLGRALIRPIGLSPLHTPLTIHYELLAWGEDLFLLPFSPLQLRVGGRVLRGRMSPTQGGFFPPPYLVLPQPLLTRSEPLGDHILIKRTLGSPLHLCSARTPSPRFLSSISQASQSLVFLHKCPLFHWGWE